MTIKELEWRDHSIGRGCKHAVVDFANGYSASVIFGPFFYSNGVDTYEIAVMTAKGLCYDTPITDDVLGHLDEEEANAAFAAIEALPARQEATNA
jgi:hypothetical protein